MTGTSQRPRLCVHRSLTNLYGQIIDDTSNRTLFSLSTRDKEIKEKLKGHKIIKEINEKEGKIIVELQ